MLLVSETIAAYYTSVAGHMPNMGGASYRLQVSACVSACTVAALLKARRGVVNVACRERKKMATAPEESATAELKQLSINDPDYNPFSDEGK